MDKVIIIIIILLMLNKKKRPWWEMAMEQAARFDDPNLQYKWMENAARASGDSWSVAFDDDSWTMEVYQ